jgi:sugar phosphate permease
LPDGAKAGPPKLSSSKQSVLEEHWTSSEAVRTPAFWIVGMGLASMSMLSTGLQFHMVSIFEDGGLSASAAAAAFGSIALTSAVVRIVSGIIVDRVPVRFLLFAALVGQVASLVMAPRLHDAPTALSYGVVLGITNSLALTVSAVVWAKYFGRRHLGSISGIASLVLVGGSALGPMPMGIARDLLGSYDTVLTAASALPLLLAVAVLSVRRPRRDSEANVDVGMSF